MKDARILCRDGSVYEGDIITELRNDNEDFFIVMKNAKVVCRNHEGWDEPPPGHLVIIHWEDIRRVFVNETDYFRQFKQMRFPFPFQDHTGGDA